MAGAIEGARMLLAGGATAGGGGGGGGGTSSLALLCESAQTHGHAEIGDSRCKKRGKTGEVEVHDRRDPSYLAETRPELRVLLARGRRLPVPRAIPNLFHR